MKIAVWCSLLHRRGRHGRPLPNAAPIAELRGENADLTAAVASFEEKLDAAGDRGAAEIPGRLVQVPAVRLAFREAHRGRPSSRTNWAGRTTDLLEAGRGAAEATRAREPRAGDGRDPVKTGTKAPGKTRLRYFWPIYDEIVLPFAPTREHRHVEAFLGDFEGVLSSDGYDAYAPHGTASPRTVTRT